MLEQKNEDAIIRIIPRARLRNLVVNICDHCNLNCCSCDHFSPIAEDRFYDPERIIKDIGRLRELIGDRIDLISVMGGEPLLHPELEAILSGIRGIYPNTEIWLSTNGLLLAKMRNVFWEIISNNNITINVTKYPVTVDYDAIKRKASEMGVDYQYYNDTSKEKTMGHYPLDINGHQDPSASFVNCYHANKDCNMLQDGKLYTCTIAPCIPIFNKKFGLDIPLTEDDGIDIYKIDNKRELFKRLAEPMPICRFCDVKHRSFGHEWKQSTGDISEWI